MRARDWAASELSLWSDLQLERAALDARLEAQAHRHISVFLFDLKDGRATFRDKAEQRPGIRDEEPLYPSVVHRAEEYARLFSDAMFRFGLRGEGLIAVDLGDLHDYEPDVPIFAFQRRYGSRFMLMPDIEFITTDFYVDDRHRDFVDAGDKLDQAIFVGSTTGAAINAEMVRTLDHTRLRSAVFFKGREDVVFDLPAITQYDSEETRELIADLDVAGRRRTWGDQLHYRYILSIDGNGATCSRLVLALGSNSVPVKYVSNHELYYFRGLQPYRHYLPIDRDQDVLTLLRRSASDADDHATVAAASREFCRRTLSRIHVLRYTAELLSAYLQLHGSGAGAPKVSDDFRVDAFVHRAGIGTCWLDQPAWPDVGASPIEGFGLVCGEDLDPDDLIYAGIDGAGDMSHPLPGGEYCGTRGLGRALHGLYVALRGPSGKRFSIEVEALFADGTMSTMGTTGVFHAAAPLVDFRLRVRPRRGRPSRRVSRSRAA